MQWQTRWLRPLKIDPVLMGATMDRLFEDEYVQTLWNLWQSGEEGGTVPPPPPPGGGGDGGAGNAAVANARAAAAAAGAGGSALLDARTQGSSSTAPAAPQGPGAPGGTDLPAKKE